MSISFANASLAGLTLLVAIPLLIHLFARGRPPVVPFSSVEFLRKIIRSTSQVRRPKDWLLLLLRSLVVLALVGALLRPSLFSHGRLGGAKGEKNVVILVDRTASMAATDGARSRFSSACAAAAEALKSLGTGDHANIVWLDANPDAVFPEPGVAFGALQDELGRASVSDEAANFPGAMALVSEMFDHHDGDREFWVISDFQGSAWADKMPELSVDAELVMVRIGADRPPNRAVVSLYADNPRPLVGEEISVFCEVANYADEPRTAMVFLEAGEIRQSEELSLPAGETGVAVFRCRFSEGGIVAMRASVDDGDFAADDSRHYAVHVSESLRVGLLASEPESAAVFEEVFAALDWVSVDRLTPGDLAAAGDYDALLLSGWTGAEAGSVNRAIASGTTVIALPAVGSPAGAFRLDMEAGALLERRAVASAVPFVVASAEDAMFALFAEGEFGDPASGSSSRRLKIDKNATAGPGWTALVNYADGSPAIARHQESGGGAMLLWNIPFDDPDALRWAREPGFVPLVGEILLVARSSAPGADFFANAEPGTPLSWRVEREILAAEASLLDSGGVEMKMIAEAGGGATSLRASGSSPLGIYRWKNGTKLLGYGAVNFPPVESNLASGDPAELATGGAAITLGTGSEAIALRSGLPLWPLLACAAILLMLTEGCVALSTKSQ